MYMPDIAEEMQNRVEYDVGTNTYRLDYDWSESEPVSTAVTVAVAAAIDSSPTDMESIDNAADPDALDRLFHPRWTDSSRNDGGRVVFDLADCEVTLRRSGEIVVRAPDDRSRNSL